MKTEIIKAIEQILAQKQRALVFVCGFGGAGKSTFCKDLSSNFPDQSVVFETDWYSKYATMDRRQRIRDAVDSGDAERIANEENPLNWYDWNLWQSDLQTLMTSGSLTIINGWSQATGEKELNLELRIPESDKSVVLCDGLYLLHPEIRGLADLRVLLDAPVDVVIERANKRDAHRSSAQYLSYKASLLRKYDEPYFNQYRIYADVVLKL